ncbi:hypothetical protein L226DRAFT_539941 [Lentinus tigrinus ALCF2SS1-7]|uniref:uncharacterized protein n=1 Tax=Lentinus tigrinus ALCF2SS1-7 TaxID=1328758 RepID=UPI0011660E84|nr:hypothetical protein L226DRAFT_539941 [Lentinus tigrinus ALCF2SS1-7]
MTIAEVEFYGPWRERAAASGFVIVGYLLVLQLYAKQRRRSSAIKLFKVPMKLSLLYSKC